ncbi:hypothetical protein BHE74_00030988 [Ensete ventricosum]|nr:hypothetical protein BHE74_00030988 [Ensete ventricosum]
MIDRRKAFVGITMNFGATSITTKKGRLSMLEPIEESKEGDLEPEEENTKEDSHSTDCMTHTLAGHVNPQAMKVEESLKQ